MVVFFDLDGTLLDHAGAQRAAALELLHHFVDTLDHTGESFIELWDDVAEKYLHEFLASRMTFTEVRRARMRDVFDQQMTDAEADRVFGTYLVHYEANWAAFTDVMPCLDRLAGHALAVITNGNTEQQLQKLDAMGLGDRFLALIVSEAVGVAKPDQRIFDIACERVGADPAECVYVGDRLETDARAAKRAGLQGVWLDRKASGLAVADVPVIHGLGALPGLFSHLIF